MDHCPGPRCLGVGMRANPVGDFPARAREPQSTVSSARRCSVAVTSRTRAATAGCARGHSAAGRQGTGVTVAAGLGEAWTAGRVVVWLGQPFDLTSVQSIVSVVHAIADFSYRDDRPPLQLSHRRAARAGNHLGSPRNPPTHGALAGGGDIAAPLAPAIGSLTTPPPRLDR